MFWHGPSREAGRLKVRHERVSEIRVIDNLSERLSPQKKECYGAINRRAIMVRLYV